MTTTDSSRSDAPEITVVIPTRHRWAFLHESVRSALSQQDTTLEVIVVQDGSSGAPPTLLEHEGDPRVTVHRLSDAVGQAAARNTGIRLARGEWIAFLDDDDLWAPWKLRRQIDAAKAAGATFAYGGAVVVSASLSPLEVLPPPPAERLAEEILRRNIIPAGASNVVVKTNAVRALGGFDEQLSHLCDWDLWIRLAITQPGTPCPGVAVAYRQHEGNLVITSQNEISAELRYVGAKHAAMRRVAGVRLDAKAFREWRAAGHARARRRTRTAWAYLYLAGRYRSRTAARVAMRSAFGRWREEVPPPLERTDLGWLRLTQQSAGGDDQ
jgi:glycosyltransferase involved in cell wall biosynthesis